MGITSVINEQTQATQDGAQGGQVSSNASADIAIKSENITYNVYVKVGQDGKVDPEVKGSVVYTSNEKTIKEYDKPDSGYTLAKTQTVRTYKAGTVQGFVDLIGDEEEAVNIINRGLTQKSNQKVSEYLTDFDVATQAFVNQSEDVFDSREALQEATQRRNLSPLEKAQKAIRQIPGYQNIDIAALLQQLQAASSAQ